MACRFAGGWGLSVHPVTERPSAANRRRLSRSRHSLAGGCKRCLLFTTPHHQAIHACECAANATGEAMVAAQALSLLAWDATATFLLNPTKPALVDHQGALRPEAVGLFVEGLLVRSTESRK
jgi:hypothetical protein